ncbi:hypothetical protein PRNP1_007727 [Phytophthora ramorum]
MYHASDGVRYRQCRQQSSWSVELRDPSSCARLVHEGGTASHLRFCRGIVRCKVALSIRSLSFQVQLIGIWWFRPTVFIVHVRD